MKKIFSVAVLLMVISFFSFHLKAQVGINTTSPQAMLHVKDSSVLFSGNTFIPINPGNPPASGAGVRMMWYPDKGAFRAGVVSGTQWDMENIGFHSVAMGRNNVASGDQSTAMGIDNAASGTNSTAMGDVNVASGGNSTAMGLLNVASGGNSTAMGAFNVASGNLSTTMGFFNSSRAFASLTIGQLNDSIAGSSRITWVDTDPVFIIGNGTSDLNRSNAFVVNKNGNTVVSGEVQRPATGNANLVPIAYGSIAIDGTITSGTGNFTVTKPLTGQYQIVLTGITYTNADFVTSVSVRAADGVVRVPVTTSINGDLVIRVYNLSNTKVDTDFHFVVYLP